MIIGLLDIALGVLMMVAFYQDWKFRAIHWSIFPVLFGTSLWILGIHDFDWRIIFVNTLFLAIVFTALIGYISLKRGTWVNIFKSDFGLGDVLFLVAITPLFGPKNFVLFFILGMLFSGALHMVLRRYSSDRRIPLAGYLSLLVLILNTVSWITNTHFQYTEWI